MKQLALFDFDGTITTKDTLLEIAKFSSGTLTYLTKMAFFLPVFVCMKFQLISKQTGKEQFIRFFFGKKTEAGFTKLCEKFANDRVPELIRHLALKELAAHQKLGNKVAIVSASPENWIIPWADRYGIEVISTKLRFAGDRFAAIDGINCNGEEKVRRIRQAFTLEDYDKVIAYGDTRGDHPMLALADEKHYKPFR